MKEQLLLLIELQECDSQLVKMESKKKQLPEKISKLEEDFNSLKKGMEQSREKYEALKAQHADNETKIKKLNEGIVKTRERLLEVKNNKEYQALLKEIEIAEASRSDLETVIISILDELEKLSVQVKKDQTALDEYRKKYEEERMILESDLNSMAADSVSWEQKRVDLKKKVPAELLARYEKIKSRNNGIGVSAVWKAVCNGCHMNIPPQLYNELQKSSELHSCPNCHRIMYFQSIEKPT